MWEESVSVSMGGEGVCVREESVWVERVCVGGE